MLLNVILSSILDTGNIVLNLIWNEVLRPLFTKVFAPQMYTKTVLCQTQWIEQILDCVNTTF